MLTRAELLGHGLSDHAIARWRRQGRLHRMFYGVYLYGAPIPPPLGWETAALLAGGPDAMLVLHSSAATWGFGERDNVVHINVADRRCRRQPGLHPHCFQVAPHEVLTHCGLRLTSPQRTLQDLASFLDPVTLERITNEAEVNRQIPRRPGALPTRREAERRLTALLLRAGLPPTHANTRIAGYEVDLLYAPERLVIEMDSFQFHGTRHAFERDRRKDAALLAAGHRVLRVTWRQLTESPEALIAQVARALSAPCTGGDGDPRSSSRPAGPPIHGG